MTDLTALAARIEREGPSRELDAEIARAIGWQQRDDFPNRWQSPARQFSPLPEFTSSPALLVKALIARTRALDAALRWVLDHSNDPAVIREVRAVLGDVK